MKTLKKKRTKKATRMTTEDGNPIFLTPDDLVKRYRGQVNKRTLANWRSHREGPKYTKAGGRVLYPLRHVLDWEDKRTSKI